MNPTLIPDLLTAPALPVTAIAFDRLSGQLTVTQTRQYPPVRRHPASGARTLYICGNPVVDGQRDDRAVLRQLEAIPALHGFARSLDGSFLLLLHDPLSGTLSIITDRFGSMPFFYRLEATALLGASSLQHLMAMARAAGWPQQVDAACAFEFVYFRRLFGQHTYEPHSQFPGSAVILTIGAPDRTMERHVYWYPTGGAMATASTVPLPEYAAQVAAALRHAVAMYRSDQPRDGLLLSGGLDARAVLAASAPPPPVCLTTAPRHNNEVAIAHALARCVGAVHHFMPRPERLLDQLVEPAIFLGGMTVYNEMQFGNYSALIPPGTEMLMMGLALDILLCGHYLPKQPLRVLGRDGYLFRLQPLEHDLAGQFIRSVSYRMKGMDPFTLLKPQRRNAMQEALRSTVAQQMAIGRGHGLDGYDLWESMHLRDFARHYSFLMVASVRCYADCRIPALSNQLYDLALGMPLGYKVNWHAYQQAITQLNPAMMDVRNSNTNIRAATPLWRQSLIRWSRGLANRIPGVHLPRPPSDTDRSWPAVRQSIDVNPTIQDYVSQLASSPCLDALDLFDMDRIGQLVAAHRAGARDYSVCLNVLVTLDRFLRTQEDLL